MKNMHKLNTFALTLLITGAIDSIRNLPASALFGSTLIFFFIFAAIVFLIPVALVSAELAANIDEGGIYQWVRLAFGERMGFIAIWLQWISNAVWFPIILSFVAGTAAYLINPALAENKAYLVGSILSVFWVLTFVNMRGIHLSSRFTSFCAITGLIIPVAFIISLMCAWLISGKPLQIHLSAASIFPSFHHVDNWLALTAIILSFCGMELATVHIKDVHNPRKTFPASLGISTVIILSTMILGSLAIAFVIPYDQINLVNGTIQTFSYFLTAYHLEWFLPILTLMLISGSVGGVISWIISPIRGLTHASEHGFLPPLFQQTNRHGVSAPLLIAQAVIVSVICLAFLLFPGVNGSFWLLTALSTQLYILMYVLMFCAALRLRHRMGTNKNAFMIPGGKWGLFAVCLLGLIGCFVALTVGFIPPNNMNIISHAYYELLFISGIVFMIAPAGFFIWYQQHIPGRLVVEAE